MLAGLDLGEVEDLIDEEKEIFACGVDGLRVLELFGREIALGVVRQELRKEEHAVERRPELVRHVREELGFVRAHRRELGGLLLEAAADFLEVGVLCLEREALLCELPRVLPEFFVGLPELLLLATELLVRRLQLLFLAQELRRLLLRPAEELTCRCSALRDRDADRDVLACGEQELARRFG